MRNSLLIFGLELETKDMIAVSARFIKLFHRVEKASNGMLRRALGK